MWVVPQKLKSHCFTEHRFTRNGQIGLVFQMQNKPDSHFLVWGCMWRIQAWNTLSHLGWENKSDLESNLSFALTSWKCVNCYQSLACLHPRRNVFSCHQSYFATRNIPSSPARSGLTPWVRVSYLESGRAPCMHVRGKANGFRMCSPPHSPAVSHLPTWQKQKLY